MQAFTMSDNVKIYLKRFQDIDLAYSENVP